MTARADVRDGKTGKTVDAFGITLDFVARFIHWARETCRSRETRLVGKRRLKDVPRALKEMREILDKEMAVDRLDSYLAGFYDYHQGDPEAAKMRLWNKTSLNVKDTAISREQVVGMPLEDLVAMMHTSMEVEIPIHSYTIESGDAFQFILSSLGRFMGITKKQAQLLVLATLAESKHADKFPNDAALKSAITTAIDQYHRGNGLIGVFEGLTDEEIANAYTNGVKSCEAPWCAEEYRHAQLLRRLIRILTGREPENTRSADPTITKNDDESAFKHLSGRNYTETGSAGTYALMASHTRAELRLALINLVGDELKHLTVVGAADIYLRGKDANNRLIRMLEKGISELDEAANERTAGKKVYSNPFNIFEALMALLMIEVRMRRYLCNLPLMTLERVFDTPSRLPERPSLSTPQEREENARRVEENKRLRKELAHWPERLRKAAFKQRRFEESHQELIKKIIATRLGGLQGVESSETQMNKVLAMIKGLDFSHEGLAALRGDNEGQAHLKDVLVDAAVDRRIMSRSGLHLQLFATQSGSPSK
jgi:hypothetical protein